MNSFKHGLATIDKSRRNGALRGREKRIKAQIRDGLILDKGGADKVSTAEKVLAEIISDDAAWLAVFNGAIARVLRLSPKARANPRGLAQLDNYKRPIINSLAMNIQKYGLEKVKQVKDIYDVLAEEEETPGGEEAGA